MKLEITIEGIPKINRSVNYTRNGRDYKPVTEMENGNKLRAEIISRLPYDFIPFRGTVRIMKLHFVFPPATSITEEERKRLFESGAIEKTGRPDIIDCLKSIFRAILGTVFLSETQVCEITDLKKLCSLNPGIEIVVEDAG